MFSTRSSPRRTTLGRCCAGWRTTRSDRAALPGLSPGRPGTNCPPRRATREETPETMERDQGNPQAHGVVTRAAGSRDVDAVTGLHTEARAAYYLAGGFSGPQLASPEALARRRKAWEDLVRREGTTVRCAERDGELVGILAM